MSSHVVACGRVSSVAVGATLAMACCLSLPSARADPPAKRPPPDPLGPLMAAARSRDRGELARLAARVATAELAGCITKAARPRRMACTEASVFVAAPSVALLAALTEALIARDRAVAGAAGEALERLVEPERLLEAEIGATDAAPVLGALATAAADVRLGVDVRAAALHVLGRFPHATVETAALLSDPDPLVRREAIATLANRSETRRALARTAERDADDGVAAAALSESGAVAAPIARRVRGWLTAGKLGPASLGPLLACARSRNDGPARAWLEAAAHSTRADVRALAAPPTP